jgi:hypothetical protein
MQSTDFDPTISPAIDSGNPAHSAVIAMITPVNRSALKGIQYILWNGVRKLGSLLGNELSARKEVEW